MTLRSARLWLFLGMAATVPGLMAQIPPTGAAKPVPHVAPMPPPKVNGDMVESFKLSDGDIDAVLDRLEFFTGRTVVRPGQLPTATYSLKISRPIPKAELVTALETILALNGVAVSPMGDRFLKVTALSQAKSESPEMIMGTSLNLPPSGRIVTKLFELNFLRVSEFVPQIQAFMTPGIGGGIVQLEKANVALVTDSLENIQRIERLLDEVDKPRENSLTPKFYALHNGAKASDVVQKIHAMLSGQAGNQLRATTTYTADDRTNQIVLIADPKEYPLFDSLISQLDIVSDPNTRNEVILLKHADAKDVASLLGLVISGQTAAAAKAAANSVRPGQVVQPAAPGAPTPAPAATATLVTNESVPATSQFSGFITVEPDERTNSIVVSGTLDDIRIIKAIVEKIDVLLAQVSIQVVIAEVTLSDTDSSGINALGLTVGQTTSGATSITQFTGAIAGWNVTSGIINPLQFAAAIQAAGDKHKVKILQQDTITTTHNKQATFTVSEQLPVITGETGVPLASTTTNNSFATSSTVTYKDIGITLKVTPLIGDDGSIQLNIDQTVDDDQGSVTIDGNSQPIIGHREATSFINVMDGQMAVLGGLQSSGRTTDQQKIGLLYEIPLISNLLGFRNVDLERTELLLFIRPHVLSVEEESHDAKAHDRGNVATRTRSSSSWRIPSSMPDPKETLKDTPELGPPGPDCRHARDPAGHPSRGHRRAPDRRAAPGRGRGAPRPRGLPPWWRRSASTRTRSCALVAGAAGLDIATNLETDPGARGLLPGAARPRLPDHPDPLRRRGGADAEPSPLPTTPLHLASAWLPDPSMADWLRTFTPRPLVWHLAVPERVHQLIIENFGVGSGALEDSDEGYVAPEAQQDAEAEVDEDAAVVRFVTDVITQAVDDQATDIHFEPQEGQLRIRYRVDGLLVPVSVPENLLRFQDAIISRVKIMARLNISERRLPQDGRINFKAGGNDARHPRLDDPDHLRRVDLAAPPQQEEGGLHDGQARDERGRAGADQAGPRLPARHHPRDRARPARARARR